ncbi:MAG TPA: lanthionine synthetase LanC family protein [Nocardioidaceae bacterium]|nr:lanthionine synthetase LanC family protein [Nocardioidaceae bacterium]
MESVSSDPSTYRGLAERAWAWVLTQVKRSDHGLWLGEHPGQTEPGDYPYGMHSGIGGLAYAIEELRLSRPLTADELALGAEIGDTLVRRIPVETMCDYFDGHSSTIGVLTALQAPGADLAVARLHELATPDGWSAPFAEPPRAVRGGSCNDATLGTASVLLGALWALRHDVPGAAELADHAVGILLEEQEQRPEGPYWPFMPLRFLLRPDVQMPNWSHGQAGVAAALAAAGIALDRPDLVETATAGAEYLLSLGDTSDGGLRFPHVIPGQDDLDTFTYSWCHGPTGTSLLFAALSRAGVTDVGGASPEELELACLHSLHVSGIPERLYPGFWDNDGRCCGTAGAGDVVLNAWQRDGRDEDLTFAITLADAIVERAIDSDGYAFWRFVEHRNEDPLLPPGPGWMQGASGIAAYLFRLARLLEDGREAATVPRMDTWWATPK